jgi:gamma-glutamylcyclotransferase (GGCT)/AIG2-like uncharacterized protein YtfP
LRDSRHQEKNLKTYPGWYFAYGSNMNHAQMAARCPTARFIKPYYLRGWQLDFACHATVVPRRGAVVPGAIWHITDDDLRALDRYEGYPTYYTRRRWRQDDDYFFFYEMTPDTGTPSAGYVRGILQGYRDCGIDSPNHTRMLEQYLEISV